MHCTTMIHLDVEAGTPPTEFRIFSAGEVKTKKGTFLFDAIAAERVIAAAEEAGTDFALDYGHAMFKAGVVPHPDPAEGHKAAGWFTLEMRGGELWAKDVTWTPKAVQKLKEREYRYVSPTFSVAADGSDRRIVELLNVALTNVPATHHSPPLMADATEETTMMTTDGIEVPDNLAMFGMTRESFLSTRREQIRLGLEKPDNPELFRRAVWEATQDGAMTDESLAFVGLDRATFDKRRVALALDERRDEKGGA